MKNKARFFTLLLALLLVLSAGMAVSAAPATNSGSEAPGISQTESIVSDSGSEESTVANISSLQGEEPVGPEAPDEAAPAPQKSSNTPFFVGAGIAVLLFAGVAVYCKTNGNKTL